MSKTNPLSERCTAHSKSKGGERCLRWVVGSGVCAVHGRSKRVLAAQQGRAAQMRLEIEAAKNGQVYERRHPAAVLLDAVMGSDVVLRHLLDRRAAGKLTAEESTALGWAIDRAARVSKTAIDASIESRLLEFEETRLQRSAEDMAAAWAGLLLATLRRATLSATVKLEVWRAWYDTAREIREADVELPRAHADEVQEFRRQLELEAAEEAAAIESIAEEVDEEEEDAELADVSLLFPRGPGSVA